MRSLLLIMLMGVSLAIAQTSSSSKPQKSDSNSSARSTASNPKLEPPSSDHVDASALDDAPGDSSSKDTQIDLSPPPNDDKDHPQSSDVLKDEGVSAGGGDTTEFHPWNPHKAAKDIEVGDYYFKRKNYTGAESRYREALVYKDNDAVATFKLALCLEKLNRPDEALEQYESYLKILPYGPEAGEAKKAIDRLKTPAASAKPN